MRRMHSQHGFSLMELTTTIAIVGILTAIVTGQFSGTRSEADARALTSKIDAQANAVMTWASQQETFNDTTGLRINPNELVVNMAGAMENKTLSTAQAEKLVVKGSTASAAPDDSRTMVFSDATLGGERIRLTACEPSYFTSGASLCARADIFPWGNNQANAPSVVYRFLQCSGAACASSPGEVFISDAECDRWPEALPSRSGGDESATSCPSTSSPSET